jgi:hypothetical protein
MPILLRLIRGGKVMVGVFRRLEVGNVSVPVLRPHMSLLIVYLLQNLMTVELILSIAFTPLLVI